MNDNSVQNLAGSTITNTLGGINNLINAVNSAQAPTTGTVAPLATGGTVNPVNPTVDAINNSFDVTISGLRDLLNAVPDQRSNARERVSNLYDNSRGQLTSARDRGFQTVDNARERTERDLGTGTRRLGEVGLQALRGFNNQLGTMGASSSSAANLGAEAIGRDQTRLRSDLFNQAQDRYNELDTTRSNIESDYNLQVNELNTWKNNNILDITQQYEELQRQIRQQMSTANAERQLALAEMSQELANSAANQIATVTSDYQNALGSMGNVNNPAINTSGLSVQNAYNPLNFNPSINGRIQLQGTRPQLQSNATGIQAGTGQIQGSPRRDNEGGLTQRDLLNQRTSGLRVN